MIQPANEQIFRTTFNQNAEIIKLLAIFSRGSDGDMSALSKVADLEFWKYDVEQIRGEVKRWLYDVEGKVELVLRFYDALDWGADTSIEELRVMTDSTQSILQILRQRLEQLAEPA